MFELDLQVRRFVLLAGCSTLIYLNRNRKSLVFRLILLLAVSLQSLVLFKNMNARLVDSNEDLLMFERLGLPRAFSSEQYRMAKREVFQRYHPDRGTSALDKEQKLETFQRLENYLSYLENSRKRELLDKFNASKWAPTTDSE